MTNLLQISVLALSLTNFQFHTEPGPTNDGYYTNFGTNLIVSGTAMHTAFIGSNLVRIYWPRPATNCLLQTSSNLAQWQDIRVLFAGPTAPTQWLVYPLDRAAFYRLRTQ